MRLRGSSGRILDLTIRLGMLATISCASLDGLSDSESKKAGSGGPPGESTSDRGKRSGGTLEPEVSPGSPTKTFCEATSVTFCADFQGDLMTGWTSRSGVHGDTRLIENTFAAVTEPVAEGIVPRAYLRKDFAAAEHQDKATIVYTFAVRVDQVGATPTKGGTLAVLALGTAPLDYELQLNVFADGKTVLTERGPAGDGGARPYREHPLPSFVVGAWRRIEVGVRRAAGTLDVSIDGTNVLAPNASSVAAFPTAALSFYLGVTYADPPAAPWTVRYDDVAVDLR